METVGASRIFLRSDEKQKLKYTEYYGDGDSKGYLYVQNTYGSNHVSQLECIGHVQEKSRFSVEKIENKN